MNVIFHDLQAVENPLNGSALCPSGVKELLSASRAREPFLFELRGEHGLMLTIGLAGSVGAVQYSASGGLPPCLMALGEPGAEPDFVEFKARGTPTRILRRYCLPVDRLEEVVGRFLEDGTRLERIDWEEL